MLKKNHGSRRFRLALAAAVLATSAFEIPKPDALDFTAAHAGDTAQTASAAAVRNYAAEPYTIPMSGIDLIWNHLR